MKVFLDDERPTPTGWIRAYWPDEVIALLNTGQVEELSLDHDLGDDHRGTGYDVILWIEKAVALRGFVPPRITCIQPIRQPRRGCLPVLKLSRDWFANDGTEIDYEAPPTFEVLTNANSRYPLSWVRSGSAI